MESKLGALVIKKRKVEDQSTRQATAIQQLNANLADVETKKNAAEDQSKLLKSNMATAAAKAGLRIQFLKADAEQLLKLIASQ